MVTVNRKRHQHNRATLRHALIALSLLSAPVMQVAPAAAQAGIGVSISGISIGIHQPFYPELVLVPGTPVYYAPHAQTNYFFYDGLFWVYQDDRWYASAWYDGPWDPVDPYYVPLFVLRVPVQYYPRPPAHFYGWVVTAPPRWDIHWGPRWVQHRHGWDHWDYRAIPRPAPPPLYQRHYSGDRYPRAEVQHDLRDQHYRYQPRDAAVRRSFHERPASRVPPPVQIMPPTRPDAPLARYPQRDHDDDRRPPAQAAPQPREPVAQEQRLQRHEQYRRELHSQELPRQDAQSQHMRRPESARAAQTPSPVAPAFVQPQPERRPREEVQRAAPVQAAPLMAPPPGREHPAQEQRHVMRQEAPRPQRDSAPQQIRPHEAPGRGNDQNRGNHDRGRMR